MAAIRAKPEFKFLRNHLPPLPHSKANPLSLNLCTADLFGAHFLRLDDKEWNEFLAERTGEEGLVTGDPLFDEMERKLFEDLAAEESETLEADSGTNKDITSPPETGNA